MSTKAKFPQPPRRARLIGAALVCALALAPAGVAEAAKCTQKGTAKVDVLKGTKKKDVLCAKGGDDVVIGKGGNDVLKGGAGDDSLIGKSGDDSLAGGKGDDTLAGGKGDDKLNGQAGIDVAGFAAAPAPVTADLAAGTASGDGTDSLITIENLVGSPFNDELTGDGAANELSAGEGDDRIQGGAGDDALEGQGGIDATSYAAVGGPVVADLRAGTVTGDGADSIAGIENLTGSSQADLIAGDDAANVLDGGPGRDTITFAGAPAGIDADLGAGGATGDGTDTLVGFEDLTGSAHADTLAGDSAANLVRGGEGDDTLTGAAGNDQLDGGGGADTASYSAAPGPISADLRAATVSGHGADTLAAVENVTGSPQGDSFAGDAAANILDGAGGGDTVSFAASPAGISSNLATGATAGDGADSLLGIENLIGSTHPDSITGDPGANAIAGGPGDDTLSAAAGNDQLSGETGNDGLFGEDGDDKIGGGSGDDHLDGGLGVNDCDGGTGVNTYAAGCDGDPPALTAFAISPPSVNTFIAAADVDFALTVTDAAVGVDPTQSRVIVHAPSGTPTFDSPLVLTGGDSRNGTYTAAVTLPRYSAAGTWTVEVELADQSGNRALLTTSALAAAGRPHDFQQNGVGDTTGPALTSFTRSPASIDTAGSSRIVTFDLGATDDLSGIDAASSIVTVHGPGGRPTFEAPLTLVSGDPLDGTFQATITLPRYSAAGTWAIELSLVDGATNATATTTAGLASAGFPSTFSQVGAGDSAAPALTAFDRSPAEVNTAEGAKTVDFTLSATDTLSGVDPAASRVIVYDPVDQPGGESALQLTGGTSTNGSYQAAISLPEGSTPGTWKIEVRLVDDAGNVEIVTSAELTAAGLPGTFSNVAPTGT